MCYKLDVFNMRRVREIVSKKLAQESQKFMSNERLFKIKGSRELSLILSEMIRSYETNG